MGQYKIKRDILIKYYKLGGLKILDIDIFIYSLKCSWIKRCFNIENTGALKQSFLDILNRHGGKLIFKSNLDIKTKTSVSKAFISTTNHYILNKN